MEIEVHSHRGGSRGNGEELPPKETPDKEKEKEPPSEGGGNDRGSGR